VNFAEITGGRQANCLYSKRNQPTHTSNSPENGLTQGKKPCDQRRSGPRLAIESPGQRQILVRPNKSSAQCSQRRISTHLRRVHRPGSATPIQKRCDQWPSPGLLASGTGKAEERMNTPPYYIVCRARTLVSLCSILALGAVTCFNLTIDFS
jgi:hypothetical protein